VTPLQRERNSAWDWSYPYWSGKINSEAKTELDTWKRTQSAQFDQARSWGRSIKETRVDVSEAIDAIAKIRTVANVTTQLRFYECLFSGVKFDAKLLDLGQFDRCTFSDCAFRAAAKYEFLNCELINCRFSNSNGAKFSLRRCKIDGLAIRGLTDAAFSLTESTVSDLTIHEAQRGRIDLSRSVFQGLYVYGEDGGEIELILNYAALADGSLKGLVASPSSDLAKCALANARLSAVDFTNVHKISENTLATAQGDPATKHPQSLARPFGWATFDPDYEDDDIPF
jgi:uncharacterized protein YjbI with pentapeptide repeats